MGAQEPPTARTKGDNARWLDPEEQRAWKGLIMVAQLLPGALDRQLLGDSGVAHSDYAVLATLSESPVQRVRLSDLASLMDYSQSRLSHAMTRIEAAGWVRREPCLEDKRVFYAVLTDAGRAVLAEAAPGHVANVRRIVFDHLTAEQVLQLAAITERIAGQLVPDECRSAVSRDRAT